MAIRLNETDLREGLVLERKFRQTHDEMHAAQAQLESYMAHMALLYKVPEGWQLHDWKDGFTPPQEGEEHTHG